MALGTVLAAFPGRRRNPLAAVSAAAPIEGDGDEPVGGDEPTDDDLAPEERAHV